MTHTKVNITKAINIFLVDTSATYSDLITRSGKVGPKSYKIMRVSGKAQERAFLEPLECKLDQHTLTHSFQYVPECPVPLLGRDI